MRATNLFQGVLILTTTVAFGCPTDRSPTIIGSDGGSGTDTRSGTDVADDEDAVTAPDQGNGERDDLGGGEPDMFAADMAPPDCDTIRTRSDLSDPAPSASWRYGGGAGYPDAIALNEACMTVVSTFAELENALQGAVEGDIVYIADDAAIDVTGPTLSIPGGVWLASGRGVNGSAGGLLYGTEIVNRALLQAAGPDVRLTGLRLHGPDPGQCPPQYPDACTGEDRTGGQNCRDCMPRTSGIRSAGHDGLEVDNVEIAGFGLAGVALSDSVGHRVHHSHVHHNQRQGLGYGVLLGRGQTGVIQVLVDHNRMDYMRHAIAGSGEPGQDYEARDNLVLSHANGHVFDMHGENENTDNGSELAGGEILIHDNTVLVASHYAMVIRGRPDHGAWLYDNCLARSASNVALQRFFTGNFHIDESPAGAAPNTYQQTGPDCEPTRWCYAPGGQGAWRYLTASSYPLERLAFGDFDGDGRTDVFSTTGTKWQWVRSGTGPWNDLNTSSFDLDRLRFGDFDGDGKTDVFNANGSVWRYSSGGTGSWTELRSATRTLDQLGFGDFDGDGKTDVFMTNGTNWLWSSGGTAAPEVLNTSGAALGSLRFGDFDGDGETDVFSSGAGAWRWSRSGNSPWEDLNASSVGVEQLRFADVDGDAKTDVLRSGSDSWWYSSGGSMGWERLRIDSRSLFDVAFGQFDGDPAADVFRTGCH